MQSFWKKMVVAVLAVFVTTAFAASPKVTSKEEAPKSFQEQGYAMSEDQMTAGYNSPARIDTHGYDFSIWGSFLYWQGMQDFMELGYYPVGTGDSYTKTQEQIEMDFDWKPGFKVGIGASTDYDHWDFAAEYTWFHAKNKKSHTVDSTVYFYVPRYNNLTSTGINKVSGSWKMNFDIVDAEMARSYYVGTKLSFRTFFGARAAWLNQKYKEQLYILEVEAVPAHWWYYTGKTRNWGVGPRVGIDVNWMFTEGFRFFGNAATSILYSRYRISEKEDNVVNLENEFEILYQKSKFHALRPNLEILGGLGWGTYFGDGEYHFDLSAAYEFRFFWSQEAMRYDVIRGDLTLNGLTVTARFDF